MKLLNYIRGFRKGKEAYRLEKEAMQDPFLADAMDGYGSIGEGQEKQIELLRKRVTVRAARKKSTVMGWSAVACLVIGLCIGSYFFVQKDYLPENTLVAFEQAEPVVPVPEPAVPSADELAISSVIKPAVPSADEPTTSSVADAKSELIAAKPVAEEVATVVHSPVKGAATLVSDIIEVHGKVTDKDGDPLVGAAIAVKGTPQGTISDVEGKFALKVDGGKELVVDYIGYESMTLPVDSGKNMLIAMTDNQQALEEVVVVGYSAQKKKGITGAVSTVSIAGKPHPVIGWKSFKKYLNDSLRRPTDTECVGAKGKVALVFRINAKGRPESITIKKSLCPSADEEAVRLIKEGSDWVVGSEPVEIDIKY